MNMKENHPLYEEYVPYRLFCLLQDKNKLTFYELAFLKSFIRLLEKIKIEYVIA